MTTHPPKHTTTLQSRQSIRVIRRWSLQNSGVGHSIRELLVPPAASGSSPAAADPRPSSRLRDTAVPHIPTNVHQKIAAARSSWLHRCLRAPLVDPVTNSRVHVYGNIHFAPFGGAEGLADLHQLLHQLQPTVLAIEQPYDLGARAGLPYPEVIHHLTGLFPDDALHLAGPGDTTPRAEDSKSGAVAPRARAAAVRAATASARAVQATRLQTLLPGLAHPARIGRDLLDPFEVLGLYGGCDYVTRPGQLVEALQLFGYLPGLEYAALVGTAQQRGVQVCSVDAPLRLQEKWVSQLAAEFTLTETDLARRLQHDLARAQDLLPAEYLAWDVSLAEAVQQLEGGRADAQQCTGNDGDDNDDDGGRSREGPIESRELPLGIITAFKVSRAVAAAAVPYEASREAFGLQAALQPLKFALFAHRARHLVLQIRDLCQRMSVRQVRVDAGKFKNTVPGAGQASQPEQSSKQASDRNGTSSGRGTTAAGSGDVALVDVSEQPEKVVLAVVGRQYMPYIEELWANERSVLWHGDVRRTFARSTLERRVGRL